MEYTRYINEFYPKSTKLDENIHFLHLRVKEIKEMPEVNIEVDGVYAFRKVKVLKVSKARITESEDGKGWNFNCKALLRIENADSN